MANNATVDLYNNPEALSEHTHSETKLRNEWIFNEKIFHNTLFITNN